MNITWYGQTCFRIISQKGRNSSVNILIDPFDKGIGLRSPKLESDILLLTNSNNKKREVPSGFGEQFLVTGPGEYDVKGVFIQGIPAPTGAKKETNSEGTTIYTIETEEMKICHLGLLDREELTSEQLEKIGEVDILMIPVGGGETIDVKGAIKIMSQIEPKIIIPMYYKIPKLKIHPVKSRKAGISPKAKLFNGVKLDGLAHQNFASQNLGGLDKFLKALGIKSLPPLPKLSIKRRDISKEEAKVIVLKA